MMKIKSTMAIANMISEGQSCNPDSNPMRFLQNMQINLYFRNLKWEDPLQETRLTVNIKK